MIYNLQVGDDFKIFEKKITVFQFQLRRITVKTGRRLGYLSPIDYAFSMSVRASLDTLGPRLI